MRFYVKLYPKKDSRYPGILSIYVRINVASKVAYHFTGIRLKPNQWDDKKDMVKPSVAGSQKIREALESMITLFTDAGLELVSTGLPFTATMIKEKALNTGTETLGVLLMKVQEHYEKDLNFDSVALVKQMIKRLVQHGENNRMITEITSMWYESLARKMELDGNIPSTIRLRLSELNKYLKLACALGYCEYDDKVFRYAKLPRNTPVEKSYLNLQEIDQIFEYWKKAKGSKKHRLAAYLVSFYLYGLRISDVLSLTRSQLDGTNKIRIVERKTGKAKTVPIPDRCLEIIEETLETKFWLDQNHSHYGSQFILPLMRHYVIRGKSKQEYEYAQKQEIIYQTKSINDFLRVLMPELGIRGKITCHTARHSFAVIAATVHKDDIRLVQHLLNHSNLKTTEIYLHSIDESRIENAARKIFKVS